MAITVTKLNETIVGNQRKVSGTYALSGGDTGGDINTGLHSVHDMHLTAMGAAVVADAPTINKTFPCAGSAVTIIATANTSGIWTAYGD